MKRAVILHGTDGSPENIWIPWLKSKLEDKGYQVWAPLLPGNHTPNREVYNNFLFGGGWDFTDNILVGHSSGAVSVLNLLMDKRSPKVKLVVLAGAWAGGLPRRYEEGNQQFVNTFPPSGFDFELIKQNTGKLAFIHGDDDPYCPIEQAEYLAKELDASLIIVQGGHHLGSKYTELPELWNIIKPSL